MFVGSPSVAVSTCRKTGHESFFQRVLSPDASLSPWDVAWRSRSLWSRTFSLAMLTGAMPEEHILKQRHVSHHQSELYWVAILVLQDFASMFSCYLFSVWSLDMFGYVWIPRSKRLGLTFGACWHLQWCCSTWERRPSAACTECVNSKHSKHFETAMAALQFESWHSVHGTWHFDHSTVLHYLIPIEYASFCSMNIQHYLAVTSMGCGAIFLGN